MDYDFDFINSNFRADKWLEDNYGCEFYKSFSGYLNCACPFEDHSDSNPSFGISLEKCIFKCFGCGRSGSFIKMVAELQSVSIIQAITIICIFESIDLNSFDVMEIKNEKFQQSLAQEDYEHNKQQRLIMKATNKIRKILKKDFEKGEQLYKKLDNLIAKSEYNLIKEFLHGTIE